MNCIGCGTALGSEAPRFCSNCGKPVSIQPTETEFSFSQDPYNDAVQNQQILDGLPTATTEGTRIAGSFNSHNIKRVIQQGTKSTFRFSGSESLADLVVWAVCAGVFFFGTIVLTTVLLSLSDLSGIVPLSWLAVAIFWIMTLGAGFATLTFVIRWASSREQAERSPGLSLQSTQELNPDVQPGSSPHTAQDAPGWWQNKRTRLMVIAGSATALVIIALLLTSTSTSMQRLTPEQEEAQFTWDNSSIAYRETQCELWYYYGPEEFFINSFFMTSPDDQRIITWLLNRNC